jgi:hypothetical protein
MWQANMHYLLWPGCGPETWSMEIIGRPYLSDLCGQGENKSNLKRQRRAKQNNPVDALSRPPDFAERGDVGVKAN